MTPGLHFSCGNVIAPIFLAIAGGWRHCYLVPLPAASSTHPLSLGEHPSLPPPKNAEGGFAPLQDPLRGQVLSKEHPRSRSWMLQGAGERCSVHPSTGGANFPKFPSRATEIRPCSRAAGADAGQTAPRCSWQPRLPPTFPNQHRGCSRTRGAGGAPPGSDVPAVTPAGASESWDPPKTHGAAAAGSQPNPFGSCCLQQHRRGLQGSCTAQPGLGGGSWAAGPPRCSVTPRRAVLDPAGGTQPGLGWRWWPETSLM